MVTKTKKPPQPSAAEIPGPSSPPVATMPTIAFTPPPIPLPATDSVISTTPLTLTDYDYDDPVPRAPPTTPMSMMATPATTPHGSNIYDQPVPPAPPPSARSSMFGGFSEDHRSIMHGRHDGQWHVKILPSSFQFDVEESKEIPSLKDIPLPDIYP